MSEEKNEEQRDEEQKANKLSDMHKHIAEQHAGAFEAWLKDHQDSTKDEAHERLVHTIESAIMLSMMSLMML